MPYYISHPASFSQSLTPSSMMREAGLKALCAATNPKFIVYLVQTNQDHKVKQISKMPLSLYVVACCQQLKQTLWIGKNTKK